MRRQVLVIAIVLTVALLLGSGSALAGDKVVSVTVPEPAAARRPDPALTGNMLFGTFYAVQQAMATAGRDVELSFIRIEVNGEEWLVVDPPRLWFSGTVPGDD